VDSGSPERRISATIFKKIGKEELGYGRRWAVEALFSAFKSLYREYCMSKNMESIFKELAVKATYTTH